MCDSCVLESFQKDVIANFRREETKMTQIIKSLEKNVDRLYKEVRKKELKYQQKKKSHGRKIQKLGLNQVKAKQQIEKFKEKITEYDDKINEVKARNRNLRESEYVDKKTILNIREDKHEKLKKQLKDLNNKIRAKALDIDDTKAEIVQQKTKIKLYLIQKKEANKQA